MMDERMNGQIGREKQLDGELDGQLDGEIGRHTC